MFSIRKGGRMNTKEVCLRLLVNQNTVNRWIAGGVLEAERVPHPLFTDLFPERYAHEILQPALLRAMGLGEQDWPLLVGLTTPQHVATWLRVSDTLVMSCLSGRIRFLTLPFDPDLVQLHRYRFQKAEVENVLGMSMSIKMASMAEAAQYLGVHQSGGMLQKWMSQGILQFIRMGSSYSITRSSLERHKATWVRTRPTTRLSRQVIISGQLITLWPTEEKLLLYLANNCGKLWWFTGLAQTLQINSRQLSEAKNRLRDQLGGMLIEQNRAENNAQRLYIGVRFSIADVQFLS